MTDKDIEYKILKPDSSLSDFVERFWMLSNHSENGKEIVIIPDGRIDIFFLRPEKMPHNVVLKGLDNKPSQVIFPPRTTFFSVNLKLLAVEYLLDTSISNLLNEGIQLPSDFWGITPEDLTDFEIFCHKVSIKIKALLKLKVDHGLKVDDRKQKLFELIYSSNGSLSVKELSEKVYWSSRQINRYFNQHFGISLKAYCNILRFRASFQHIKDGRFFPEQNFTDQAHFIKEVKKLSGVVPKELYKNKNDRFLQFSTLPEH